MKNILASLWMLALFQEVSFPMLRPYMGADSFPKPQIPVKDVSQSQPLKTKNVNNPKLHLNVRNWGNRCYLDSVLQCLRYSPRFCRWLEDNKDQFFYAHCFYDLFQDLPKNLSQNASDWAAILWKFGIKNQRPDRITQQTCYDFHREQVLSNEKLAQSESRIAEQKKVSSSFSWFPNLYGAVSSWLASLTSFSISKQEDAEECLIKFLDIFSNDIPNNREQESQNLPESLPWKMTKLSLIPKNKTGTAFNINDPRTGEFHEFSAQEEPFYVISLPVLGRNFEDMWNDSITTAPVKTAPDILFVSQKLFNTAQKIQGFPFSENLSLLEGAHLGDPVRDENGTIQEQNIIYDQQSDYELKGIVAHRGSKNSGHYVACIKDIQKDWILLNDMKDNSEIIGKNLDQGKLGVIQRDDPPFDPYIALYERVSVKKLEEPLAIPLEIPKRPEQVQPNQPPVPQQQAVASSSLSIVNFAKTVKNSIFKRIPLLQSQDTRQNLQQNTQQNLNHQQNIQQNLNHQQDRVPWQKILYALPSVAVIIAALIGYRQTYSED